MIDREFVRARRLKLKLTMAEAARRAGMSARHHWRRIETGERRNLQPETLVKVAGVLGCKVDRLLRPMKAH